MMNSAQQHVPPRLYCIQAREAPIAMVLARGNRKWWQLFRWWIDQDRLEPGAWFHGDICRRACDVSPDGRLLFYAGSNRGPHLDWPRHPWSDDRVSFSAVSRLPFLTALAARPVDSFDKAEHWPFGGGVFAPPADAEEETPETIWTPRIGTIPESERVQWSVRPARMKNRGSELESGWRDFDAFPSQALEYRLETGEHISNRWFYGPAWKPRSVGSERLMMLWGGHNEHFYPDREFVRLLYLLDRNEELPVRVPDAVWADWSHRGDLLVATNHGTIERRVVSSDGVETVWSHDLNGRTPDPQPAPEWAKSWTEPG